MAKRRVNLSEAERLAEKVVGELEPYTRRIAIAGSIRRRARMVGDIEIVAVPAFGSAGLFRDTSRNLLTDRLRELMGERRMRKVKGAEKYEQFHVGYEHAPVQLDLWKPSTLDRWGVCLAIRTGPEAFGKRLVTEQRKRGFLPDGHRVADNRLWRWLYEAGDEPQPVNEIGDMLRERGEPVGPGGVVVDGEGVWMHVSTPEEPDFFEQTTIGWVDPEART